MKLKMPNLNYDLVGTKTRKIIIDNNVKNVQFKKSKFNTFNIVGETTDNVTVV